MSKHTPIPWKRSKRGFAAVEGSTGFIVASCGGYANNRLDPAKLNAELEANAELIVSAVNNHADLLAALNHLYEVVSLHCSVPNQYYDAVTGAAAAIAKAEGQP